MNVIGGGERHNWCPAGYKAQARWTADPDTAAPGDAFLLGTPGDRRGFIHRSFIGRAVGGVVSSVVGSVPIVGGIASGLFDQLRGAGSSTVPQATACPPGFVNVGGQCRPRFTATSSLPFTGATPRRDPRITAASIGGNGAFPQPTREQERIRTSMGLAADPAAGVPVMGRFGAGFEPSVIVSDTRRCGRGAVLGVDGICYNKRDLRNNERFWPRGRRPLLTGGEMRAISTASSAAKKLQRKQKQLEGLGLIKRPAPRSRRALPAGHRAELQHTSSHG